MKWILTVALFITCFPIASTNAIAQSESRDVILKKIETQRAELGALETKFLAPSEEDVATYGEFLQQADTGLARLLPRETYDNKSLTTRGGGAYYSFTRRTHEYGLGTQIGLEQDSFGITFAGADYGMLARVGDVPLNAISLEHPVARFLDSYEPAVEEPRARTEYVRFANGVKIEDTLYKTHQPAIVNSTYVLRGIHYSDSDVLVAFRVVRKDMDDSVIILWKLLKKYPKPVLARND